MLLGLAVVKEAIRKSDSAHFAVKVVDRSKTQGQEDMLQSEIAVLRRVHHKNIVKLEEVFVTPKYLYIVMQLATGGELFDRILAKGTFTEKDAAEIILQMTEAIAYLHSQNIVHRDLKPENIIFCDPSEHSQILVTDFGLSKVIASNQFLSTTCGTPHYVPPEILKNYGHGTPADMWSIGVITYVLLCGYTPFWGGESNSTTVLYQAIVNGDYQFDEDYWSNISSEAKDFISKLLVVDQSKRMSAQAALAHPWIKNQRNTDILPNIRKNFNAKMTFKK
eukprot:jgi/Hompol1/2141/HPOL_005870-RA